MYVSYGVTPNFCTEVCINVGSRSFLKNKSETNEKLSVISFNRHCRGGNTLNCVHVRHPKDPLWLQTAGFLCNNRSPKVWHMTPASSIGIKNHTRRTKNETWSVSLYPRRWALLLEAHKVRTIWSPSSFHENYDTLLKSKQSNHTFENRYINYRGLCFGPVLRTFRGTHTLRLPPTADGNWRLARECLLGCPKITRCQRDLGAQPPNGGNLWKKFNFQCLKIFLVVQNSVTCTILEIVSSYLQKLKIKLVRWRFSPQVFWQTVFLGHPSAWSWCIRGAISSVAIVTIAIYSIPWAVWKMRDGVERYKVGIVSSASAESSRAAQVMNTYWWMSARVRFGRLRCNSRYLWLSWQMVTVWWIVFE